MALKVHKDGDNKNKNVCVSQFTRSSNVNEEKFLGVSLSISQGNLINCFIRAVSEGLIQMTE